MQHPTLNTALLHAIDETNRLLGDAYAAADVLPPTHSEMLGMGLPPADSSPVGTSDIASCSLFLRNSVSHYQICCAKNTDQRLRWTTVLILSVVEIQTEPYRFSSDYISGVDQTFLLSVRR